MPFSICTGSGGGLILGLSTAIVATVVAATLVVSAVVATIISAVIVALIVAAVIAAIVVALIVAAVIDGEQAGDGVFDLGSAHLGEAALGELEDDVGFVEGGRADVVAGVAGDDAHDNLVFIHVDLDLGGIDLVADLEELGGLSFAEVAEQTAARLHAEGVGRVDGAVLILGGHAAGLVAVGHAEDAALVDFEDGSGLDDGGAIGVLAHLDEVVLGVELVGERNLRGQQGGREDDRSK